MQNNTTPALPGITIPTGRCVAVSQLWVEVHRRSWHAAGRAVTVLSVRGKVTCSI